MDERIRIGVSACLLGRKVRYDGRDKRDPYLVETLGRLVDFVPVCPEVECGLPVPRDPLRLLGDPSAPHMVTIRTGEDQTARMRRWASRRTARLEGEGLWGFVFKGRSPSCGLKGVPVYDPEGRPARRGTGIFARIFLDRFPLLAVEEAEALADPDIREHFIERLFALERLRRLWKARKSRRALSAFHAEHGLQVLSHSPRHHRAMEELLRSAARRRPRDLYDAYRPLFLGALSVPATPARHAAVLTEALRRLTGHLPQGVIRELRKTIDQYRRGSLPLLVPLTLVAHYVGEAHHPGLETQCYLFPHPVERMLRNHP